MVLTTQSRATLGVLCRRKTRMLDLLGHVDTISLKVFYVGSYVGTEVFRCRGMVPTTQSRATLGVLCRRKTWMLDFSVPSDSISFLGFDMGCYVGLENNIKYLSQGRLFFVVGG